ncbi:MULTISPECIES: hypothetical protein [Asticcacaulis]|uniref:hypothetical protein n=1 Tax=Asticcacaulis TaxID=76890 RepID=UPI001AE22479|nr:MULTISPECIES: hypothetical protein [Asticcacaulis]MBP2159577.1 hypothetical protein [Asticcacaulis solisilvae]MDR6800596.1 hypothetical protein [Asticcacaulis sp. BE141]
MTKSTRRSILAALPFFGALAAAPAPAQAAPSLDDADALQHHIDAIKRLSGGKLNVVGFYALAAKSRKVSRAEALTESKVAFWQDRYPPGELLLLGNGHTVRIDYSDAVDADELAPGWPGSPCVTMVSADGTQRVRTLACHLPHNIIGRVL